MRNRHLEEHGIEEKKFAREAIFGFNDGLVSIFALVTGVVGAASSVNIVLLAGLIGAIAGALSMSLSGYISLKSQMEIYERERQREIHEIKEKPEIERQEIRDIYRTKGFKGKLLENIVKTISSNKRIWLRVMMEEELGLGKASFMSPIKAGLILFVSFLIGSAIPIVPYLLFNVNIGLIVSVVVSAIGLFTIGALKACVAKRNWMKSGIEMLLIGSITAAVVYYLGTIMSFGI